MLLGLLTLSAMTYGIATLTNGFVVTPVAKVVAAIMTRTVTVLREDNAEKYRPGEGPQDEVQERPFKTDPIFVRVAVFCPDLRPWLSKMIAFTISENEEFMRFRTALLIFEEIVVPNLMQDADAEMWTNVVQPQREAMAKSLIGFLEKFHPQRVQPV